MEKEGLHHNTNLRKDKSQQLQQKQQMMTSTRSLPLDVFVGPRHGRRLRSCRWNKARRTGGSCSISISCIIHMLMVLTAAMAGIEWISTHTPAVASSPGADLYDISEPILIKDTDDGAGEEDALLSVLLLRLKYGISQFQQSTDNIAVELYDEGCRGGRPPPDGAGGGPVEPYLVDESVLGTRVTLEEEDSVLGQLNNEDGVDGNLLDVAVLMNPQSISQDPNIFSYQENGVNAQIKFCVRVMLFVDSTLDIEVNYLETIVTLDVDLTDGFELGETLVKPKEQIDKRAFLPSQVEGFFCDDCYNRIEVQPNYKVVYNQGSFVRVCVRATDDTLATGISIKELWSFQYRRARTDYDDLIQVAVQDGGLPASDGLSEVDCPFPNLCVITTLLQAKFFPSPGILVGEGYAILQINKGTIPSRERERELHRLSDHAHDDDCDEYRRRRRRLRRRQMQQNQVPAPLDQYWNITNPAFRFNTDDGTEDGTGSTPETGSSKTLDFDLVYDISDAMSSENVVVDLYSKGCALDGTLVSDIQEQQPGGGSGDIGTIITHSTVSNAVQTGLGYEMQQIEYSVGLDPSRIIEYPQLYVESSNGGFGQVQLCARMSLYTTSTTSGSTTNIGGEVNFWETPVLLNFNFQSNLLLDMTVLPPTSSSVEELKQQIPGLEPVTTYCSELSSSSSSSSSSLSLSGATGLEPRSLDGVYTVPASLVAGINGDGEREATSGDVDFGPGFTWASSSASSSRMNLARLHASSSLLARLHIIVIVPILSTFLR